MTEEKKEKMVSFFDPVINAYREIPLAIAKKYLVELEKLKEEIENYE